MSERERWIVYPLLFLALGAALRDKLFDRTLSKSIVCQELTVVDTEPVGNRPARVLARIGRSDPQSGIAASGYLFLSGQLDVQGVINAQQYRYQNVPFVPSLQAVFPGVLLPDHVLRAMQQQQTQSEPAESSEPARETVEPLADPTENR